MVPKALSLQVLFRVVQFLYRVEDRGLTNHKTLKNKHFNEFKVIQVLEY